MAAMGRLILFCLLMILVTGHVFAQQMEVAVEEKSPVNWMTFEEAVAKQKIEKRKLFIDVYTDWCGWCKVMDKNTFSDPEVARILNEEFYPVKFDAEQREDVVYNGATFKFVPSGSRGYHQLAAALLNNQLSYPTVVFVDEDFTTVFPLPGYREAKEFHRYLVYFEGDFYKMGENAGEAFQKAYKSPYAAN